MREPSTTNRKWNSFFGVSISTPHSLSLKICLHCFHLSSRLHDGTEVLLQFNGLLPIIEWALELDSLDDCIFKVDFYLNKMSDKQLNINCKRTDLSFIRDLFIIIEKRAAILTKDWLAYVFYCFWLTFLLVFIISFKIGRIRIFDNVIILRKLKIDIKFINSTLLSSTSGTLLSTSSTSNDFVMVWPRFLYTEV